MNTRTPRTLPDEIALPLARLGKAVTAGRVSADVADAALAAVCGIRPEAVGQVDGLIANLAHLDWRSAPRPGTLLGLLGPNAAVFGILERCPQLAPIFLFHRNGYVRQRALETLREPPAAAFTLAALVLRMNDWVRPVRVVAQYQAERLLPLTGADVIAAAAPFLLDRWRRWGRWEDDSVAVVDAALQRPDVLPLLAERFLGAAPGPVGAQLRDALRKPGLDPYLYDLAHNAVNPAVRVLAFNTLIRARASWPVGYRKEWIDKQYGVSRQVAVFESRPVHHQHPLPALILAAIADRSAAVRRAGADALIEHRALFPEIDSTVAAMAVDRSPSIRDRAEYLERKLAEQRGGLGVATP